MLENRKLVGFFVIGLLFAISMPIVFETEIPEIPEIPDFENPDGFLLIPSSPSECTKTPYGHRVPNAPNDSDLVSFRFVMPTDYNGGNINFYWCASYTGGCNGLTIAYYDCYFFVGPPSEANYKPVPVGGENVEIRDVDDDWNGQTDDIVIFTVTAEVSGFLPFLLWENATGIPVSSDCYIGFIRWHSGETSNWNQDCFMYLTYEKNL